MALKIRLARGGAKKRPFYRIVVAEAAMPRDGRFVERLGTYNPMLPRDHDDRLVLKSERINYWLGQGARPTARGHKMLAGAGWLGRANIVVVSDHGMVPVGRALPLVSRESVVGPLPNDSRAASFLDSPKSGFRQKKT